MQPHDEGRVGRFVLSAAALILVAIALPVALTRVSVARFGSANPLAGVDPGSWSADAVGDVLSDPLTDDTVVDLLLRACLCIIWVAIAVIVVNTVAELVHLLRHRGLGLPAIRGLGWSQGIARYIAVGLLVVMPIASAKPSLALARAPATAAPAAPSSLVVEHAGTSSSFSTTSPTEHLGVQDAVESAVDTYVVRRGDSVFGIAGDLVNHDEQRTLDLAEQILDLNLDTVMVDGQRFTNPAYIEPGWVLVLPPGLATPTSPPPVSTPMDAPTIDEPVHVVVAGETLWEIAEDELGSGAEWPEIWEENAGDDMGGGRTFDDPNLILPGWELDLAPDAPVAEPASPPAIDHELPPPVEPTEPEIAATSVDPAAVDPTAAEPAAVEPAVVEPAAAEPAEAEVPAPIGRPPTSAPTPPSTTSSTIVPSGDGTAGDVDTGRTSAPDAPSPIRLEHAAMLAAGILTLVGVRRRQRLRAATPRSRVPEPRPDVVETELRLRRVDPGERSVRIDVACRSAAFHLIDTDTQIVLVQVSPDGEVALTLSGDQVPPAPWTGIADNVWQLPASIPVELLGEAARRVGMPCVAFTQLGVDEDGCEVLVDLEACGTLAIDAQPSQADAVVRGLAAGLATSLHAEIAHLVTVSISPEVTLGHRNAHQADSVDAAFDLAASLVGTTSMNDRSSFELRLLRTGGEMWEPAVILLGDRDMVDREHIVQVPEPGHGVAVVAAVGANGLPEAGARLVAEPTEWVLIAAGRSISLVPIGLDRADLDAVRAILHDAQQPLVWMDDEDNGADEERPRSRADHVEANVNVEVDKDVDGDEFVEVDHAIVVTLLGGVAVRSRDGQAGEFERSKTVELIAWLATHRQHSTRAAARAALWELDVRDATFANVVSEARRGLARLVTLRDDEEWLARTLTEQLPLHPLVVTDAELVEQRLAHARLQPPAQAIATLEPAVVMVTGMPFAGTNYLWPDAEGITSNLVLLAISACAELAGHALSVGNIELVFSATAHGLSVLPGHEELIAFRMRAHARSGNLAGVRQEWENYERVIVADAWSDGEPAPKLVSLRHELLTHFGDQPSTAT